MGKRTYLNIFFAAMFSFVLVGCASSQNEVTSVERRMDATIEKEQEVETDYIFEDSNTLDDSEEVVSHENDNAIDDDVVPMASEPETNSTKDTKTSLNAVDSKELYEKFLKNDEAVVIEPYRLFGSLHSAFFSFERAEKEDYLLSDIIQKILAEDSELYVTGIKYAFIDPMGEGKEQLLVTISTDWGDPETSSGQSYTDYKFVFNNLDGKLKLLYENEEVFRYAVTINKYGYISTGSYTGWASDEYEYRILTDDGWKFIYGASFEADNYLTPLTVFQSEQMMEVDLESLRDDAGAVWIYRFEEEGDQDMLYSYAFWNDEGEPDYRPELEEKLYGKDSPYRTAFEKAGVKFYTMPEIEKIVSQREKELGITEKIKNADEPEWNEMKDVSDYLDE